MIPAAGKRLLSRGFTLVELLIVISIIGILAVAVLSAINPVEQIRKGTDTGLKSDAAEFLNAVERFLVTFQCYPWQRTSTGCNTTVEISIPVALDTLGGNTVPTAVADAINTFPHLIKKNELKPEYNKRTNSMTKLFVTQDGDDQVHVCFLPDSKNFQDLAKVKGLKQDGTTTGCVGITGVTGCHICIPE